MQRRLLLSSLLAASAAPSVAAGLEPRALRFPADFGAHAGARTEWWYLTGSLRTGAAGAPPSYGFQITFFRSATGLGAGSTSRFAARQLIFAHAALTDLRAGRLRHDQRIARGGFGVASASEVDTGLVLRDWRLARGGGSAGSGSGGGGGPSRYVTTLSSETGRFGFDFALDATQPLLLQGDHGYSRKGPRPEQASFYYSEPQLALTGTLTLDGHALAVAGTAWLDHEWSDALLDPRAVGWDWIGMNLDDGSAFTAFRIRVADGSTLYAGGSFRRRTAAAQSFGSADLRFEPGRIWASPSSRARYPVEWLVMAPAGRFAVKALLDDQELDSRASTGAIYWEGLAELVDEQGRRVGRGYLEMTGYAAALVL